MGRVTILASGFIGRYNILNRNHLLHITNVDIARGLVTLGKDHWLQYFKNPIEILNDFGHHLLGLNTYIKTTNSNLHITNRFRSLDPSDKRIKSYNIGMGITKIVADKILNIPYLQHVDYLVNNGIATITSGTKQRGDLAGRDSSNNWHVLEAKGSSYPFSQSELDYAKYQATRIKTINGTTPHTRNSCCSSFNETTTEVLFKRS